jgi:hypothetical protein
LSPPTSLVPSPTISVTQPPARSVCAQQRKQQKHTVHFSAHSLHSSTASDLRVRNTHTIHALVGNIQAADGAPRTCSTSSFCSGLTRAKTCTRGMTLRPSPQPSMCASASPAAQQQHHCVSHHVQFTPYVTHQK